MYLKIAVVQPITHAPPNDERNIAEAVRHVEEAARAGAYLVAFPETYPGPWRMPARFDPTPHLVEAAQRHNVYVQYGTIEPIDDSAASAYNVLMLAAPTGEQPGRYRRTHPPGPWIYTGGDFWEFQYVAADDYPVFPVGPTTVGLAMCSEVYVPEVSRALALQGAELILLPAGINKRKLWATWRNLIWARAIENLAVVVTTQNVFASDERGLAMVATPEEVVFETTGSGLFLVTVDLERIRDLRARIDGVTSSRYDGTKAGLLTQWQRPELRAKFFPSVPDPFAGEEPVGQAPEPSTVHS